VDLETTGSNAELDRITEIGIVLVDGEHIEEWSSLVNPGCRIPPFIERFTGIGNDMVADAPDFESLAPRVAALLQERLFVAHNARFDYGFLRQSFRRAGHEFRATTVCTVKLSRSLYPGHRRHNLDSLIERHGLRAEGRHRALTDARLIQQFWRIAQDSLPAAEFTAALRLQCARPTLPPHLPPELATQLPEGTGVYVFHGEDDRVLYVGKARNLRQRVLGHFSGDVGSPKEMSLSQQLRRVTWTETGGEVGALLHEAALVKTLLPTHNRRLRRQSELCTVQLGEDLQSLQARIVWARDIDFSEPTRLYGLFSSERQARTALSTLADEHQLCKIALGLESAPAQRGCFARQLRRCRGVCCGEEPVMQHALRVMQALGKLQLERWPFPGAAYLREGDDLHLVANWAYLGCARSLAELHALLRRGEARFDRDCYRILAREARRLQPLPALAGDSSVDNDSAP
jgi:DNA polymerase-3 subunit epsilon